MSGVVQAILLAIIQGLTEFLPVSSSGHLALMQQFLGDNLKVGDELALDVALHLGTLVPVLWFYRADLVGLGQRVVEQGSEQGKDARRYLLYIVLGSIPTAAIGLLFKDQFKALFDSTQAVGFALLATGVLLVLSRVFDRGRSGRGPGADGRSLGAHRAGDRHPSGLGDHPRHFALGRDDRPGFDAGGSRGPKQPASASC